MNQLIYPLAGGVHPPENKHQSLQRPLRRLAIPSELIFPLSQHIGAPAKTIVEVGDKVLTGQMIAEANGPFSAAVHASTSGEVIAIEPRPIAHASGIWGDCIVLASDGKDEWQNLTPCEEPYELGSEALLNKIRNAGIAGMGGAGFPSAIKLNPPANNHIDTLIINGTECEPYITADDVLMQTRSDDIIRGCALLAKLLGGPEQILIGIEDNKPDAIRVLKQSLFTLAAESIPGIERIQLVSFPTKYPSGGEKQLIQILTGKEVPSGGLPAHIGIVVQNVGTTVAIWEAVKLGKPLIERITTVVGESLTEQGNAIVRLGCPSDFLLQEFGFQTEHCARLIAGGPMMGFSLDDSRAPIVKTSNCLLAPSHQEMPEPAAAQACIRCGHCAEACPAGLLPQQLYWYAQAKDHDRLQAHNLMDCIECGACSFVCPSNIPLVQYYRASKGDIRQAAIEKEKSDRSRERFEFRQKRMELAEAEKEAKRQARKKAAEAAKAKAAKSAQTKTDAPTADPVAAALARVQAQQSDPGEQLAKLERAVNNAQNRSESAKEKWQLAEGEQKAKLESRYKQTQVRLQDAEKKLTEFKAQESAAAQPNEASSNNDDPIARAIAKAQQRVNMSPEEKLQSSLSSLQSRLAKAKEKADGADEEKRKALLIGVEKLQVKIQVVEQEIAEFKAQKSAGEKPEQTEPTGTTDAASAAIEKAKAKAAAQAKMSDADKRSAQIESLQQRIQKAQERLDKAISENNDNVDAFRLGLEKLQAKLQELESP